MPSVLRVVFAGTPEFAARALDRLVDTAGLAPIAVLTQPDRPAGRGMKLAASPVKQRALAAGIPVHQPESLRTPAAQALLANLAPDVIVVAAYGLILPQAVLDLPRHGCINIHASLLPRWRGAAPIQRALLAGDAETGVAIMQMDAGLDTGPVLAERVVPIRPDDTAGSLQLRLADAGAEALIAVLSAIASGRPPQPRPQPQTGVTYAHKISPDEARIDWRRPAIEIERAIRAFAPTPGAWTLWRGDKLKVWGAVPTTTPCPAAAMPGTLLEHPRDCVLVATGDGALALTEVQRAGGRRMAAAAWLAGGVKAGERLG